MEVFYKKGDLKTFAKFHRKAPVSEFVFWKVVDPRQNFAGFLRKYFWSRVPPVAAFQMTRPTPFNVLCARSNRWQVFYRKILWKMRKIHKKSPEPESLFNRLPVTLFTKRSGTGVFLWILLIFSEQLFCRLWDKVFKWIK